MSTLDRAQPLISVIVPVYKTEAYLPECLDSLSAQTYHHLEIICIDDGSPDGCGRILDDYAKKDARIHVIHQKNGGLSAARNTGMEAASGEWIGFLDSDDFVKPDFIETLFRAAESERSDIAVCGFITLFEENGREIPVPMSDGPEIRSYGSREALCRLIGEQPFKDLVWNKLYRRSLWNGIRFPDGRNFEDVAVMYRIFKRANLVSAASGCPVYYRQRKGSIISDRKLVNEYDGIAAYIERYESLSKEDPSLSRLLMKSFIRRPLRHLALVGLWNRPSVHRSLKKQRNDLAAFLSGHRTEISKTVGFPDSLIVRLFLKESLFCTYFAGCIAFFIRLSEKLGWKSEKFLSEEELTEAVHGM